MSQENVEVVRTALAAWNAGRMDALSELLDPDVVTRMPEGWFEPIAFGREAVMRGLNEAREPLGYRHPWSGLATSSTLATGLR